MSKPKHGEPASFADIAFDAGVIWARWKFIGMLEDYLEAFRAPEEELMQRRMKSFIEQFQEEAKEWKK